jgi:hypothetical protein
MFTFAARQLTPAFCAILLSALSAAGATCTGGSLASYIALGSGGCTIGTTTIYDFETVSGTSGATPISTGDVTIGPLGGTFDPGVIVSVNTAAGANSLLEAIFTYRLSGPSFTSDSITLSGSSETGDGAVTDVQNYCAGGTFGPDGVTGCTGAPGSLLTLDGVQHQDATGLGPAGLLSITDDFTLDGGLSGSASGGTFTDQFTAVPEPSSYLLTGLGFAFALLLPIHLARDRRRIL